MRLALLIGHFPPGAFGGAELQAQGWARRLSDRHEVTVITRRDPGHAHARETRDGYTIVRLPVSGLPLWRTAADVGRIHAEIARMRPRPDVLLCFQTFISGLAGVLAGGRLGIPAVVWIRGEPEYRLDRSAANRHFAPRVWDAARYVLVQSLQNRVELLRHLERFDPARADRIRARVEIVPNGIDLPPAPDAPGTTVLSVGRLIRDKGMDVLIDAASGTRRTLVIAGAGPERAALEARARAARVDCRFEGFADRERLDALYREASCVVLAARHGEGLPNVLLEGMAHGRPLVATACAGARDLLVDGVNGIVIPADDPHALAAALERLAREPGLAERLGREGRRMAESYSWADARNALEHVLDRCAAPPA